MGSGFEKLGCRVHSFRFRGTHFKAGGGGGFPIGITFCLSCSGLPSCLRYFPCAVRRKLKQRHATGSQAGGALLLPGTRQ